MKKIVLSLVAGLLFTLGNSADAQVVAFVTQPAAASGNLEIGTMASGWGISLDTITASGQMVVGRSAGGAAAGDSLACDTTLINAADLAGKVVVLYRGNCDFGTKALAAQRAGAVGLVIINNQATMINMAGGNNGPNITIPVVLITQGDGARLRPFIDGDSTVILLGQKRGFFANDFGYTIDNLIRPIEYSVPANQADNAGDYIVKLGANIVNFGQNAQTNVALNVKVDFTNPAGTTSTIYNQTGTIAALAVDSTEEITVPDLDLNAHGKGRYEITYTTTANSTDDFPSDNVNVQTLILSDSIYSKARVDSVGNPFVSGGVRPGGLVGAYDMGIFFYAKRGERLQVNKLKFAFLTNAPHNLINQTVVGKVSQWLDVDLNNNIDPGEVIELGEGFYTYQDSLGSSSVREVEISDIATNLPGVRLDSNGVYIFSVQYTGTTDSVFTGIDPGISFRLSEVPYQQYTTPIFTTAWNPAGFTTHRVPAITAFMSPISTSVQDIKRNDLNIRVYPNPARSDVHIRLNAESIIGKVNYEVMDMTGRVVLSGEKMADGFNDQITLSVASLQEGVYTVMTKTNKGFNSSRFVVTK